ncbi:hypothetical protein LNO89_05780 [Klebsiella pneumoniae subsp. pneumoniae]|nr:hypothetical protein [Klebsiella pneumoniae subsp. pneumoniae]
MRPPFAFEGKGAAGGHSARPIKPPLNRLAHSPSSKA